MEITLNHMEIVYFFIGGVIPFLLLMNSKILKQGMYNDKYLAKNNTDILKGLSVVIIIIHHLSLFLVNDGIIKTLFSKIGFLAVSAFLFMSGYGLMVQFNKNKEKYLKRFISTKVLRICFIFFCANIISTLLSNLFLKNHYTALDILKSTFHVCFSDGRVLWFVAVILYFYVWFYIVYRFFNKNIGLLLIFVSLLIWVLFNILFNNGVWYYNSAICFPLGIIVAEYNMEVYDFGKKYYMYIFLIIIVLFSSGMFFYIRGINNLQFFIPILFMLLVLLLLMKVNLKSAFFSFMSEISFEFYLFQIIVFKIVFQTKNETSSLYFILAFLLIILLSKMLNIITNFVFNNK